MEHTTGKISFFNFLNFYSFFHSLDSKVNENDNNFDMFTKHRNGLNSAPEKNAAGHTSRSTMEKALIKITGKNIRKNSFTIFRLYRRARTPST